MKPFFFLLSCLLAVTAEAQRVNDVNKAMRDAEDARREQIRMEAERRLIVIRHEKNSQGNIDFYCENKAFCTYTVTITFSSLTNLQADIPLPATIEVLPGTRRIFTLRKTATPTNFQYRFQSGKGCPNPRPDTGFAYLLPVAPGKETRIFQDYYVNSRFSGESLPKDYYVLDILMHSGDTVYAARRGRVVEFSDTVALADSGISFNREENFVEIAQDDCTFARYTVFRQNSIFVQPNDWVEAGQPIGIAGGEKYTNGPHIRLSVRYRFDQDVLDKDQHPTGRIEHWAYVPLDFWIRGMGKMRLANGKTYASEHPADLITMEMSKKEARKWREAHPNAVTPTR